MLKTFQILFLVLLLSCKNSAGDKSLVIENQEVPFGIGSLVKEGNYFVDYQTYKGLSPLQVQILKKLAEKAKTNTHAEEFLVSLASKMLPYNDRAGITRSEYKALLSIDSFMSLIRKKDSLSITRANKTLHFKGSGSLSILDSLKVDLYSNKVFYKNQLLEQELENNSLPQDYIPQGDSIESSYIFKGPGGISSILFNDQYYLVVAKLNPSGNTLFSFYCKSSINFDNPVPGLCIVTLK